MIRRNISFRVLEALATILLGIIQLSLLAHSFLADIVGTWALVLTLLFFVGALGSNWGIVMVAARNVAQGADVRFSLGLAIWTQVVVAAVMLVALSLAVANISYFNPVRWPLVMLGTAILLSSIPQSSELLLIARKQMGQVCAAKIAGMLVTTLFVFVATLSAAGFSVAVVGLALSYFVTAGLTAWFARVLSYYPLPMPSRAEIIGLVREALPLVVMSLVTWLYVRIDVVMIDHMLGKSAVAHYSAAYGFLDYLMLLSNAVMVALFPHFAEAATSNSGEFRRLYRKSLMLFISYFFPLAALVAGLASPILTLLYGGEYAVGASSLAVLMIAAIFAWLNGPSGTILISLRRQHVYMIGTCVSLFVNVVANIILIPRIGIIGAAWATALTEIALCVFSLVIIYKQIGYLPFLCSVTRG